MVYGGKPSRGCGTCRARRIKCDEGKPTCQRCAKSKRECRGYRHEFDVVHRDQTNSTLRRVARQDPPNNNHQYHYHQQPRQQRHQRYHHDCQSWQQQTSTSQPTPENALTVPLAQRASCYFASNFILVSLSAAPHGFLDYLVPLVKSESHGSSLLHAFNACAFALLSNRTKADTINLSQLSLKEHTLALAQTHKALSDPATAAADATLATVLLLSLYETITARKESRMLAWRSHIDGAVNIVKTRGREMCKTKTGALLFGAVRHQIISRTLSSGIPIPFGSDWWMSAGYSSTILGIAQRFALKCGELKNSTDHILTTSHRSPEAIERVRKEAEAIRVLDHEIDNWLGSVPDENRYRTVCCVWEDDPEVFPGRVDVYPDLVTASAWNLARVTRLLLAAIYMRLTAWVCTPTMDYRDAPEYAVSRLICQRTISDILASVPYHLGWHLNRRDLAVAASDVSGFACGSGETRLKALPGFFLIWSLTCVKNHDIASPEQRAWVKERLTVISEQIGLKYAKVVNDVELRFPSMMIHRDGMSQFIDPFYRSVAPEAPLRPEVVETPITPKSMTSDKGSPSP